jgi:hypothetical protein
MAVEKYPLLISTGSIKYHLICELVTRDRAFETFRIYTEKNPDKFIELTGNRPMLRAKGLKKKAIHWEVKGDIRNQYTVDKAIKLIEAILEPPPGRKVNLPAAPFQTSNRKKRRPDAPNWGKLNHKS